MKLTLDDFKSIACGAVEIEESHGAVAFHRFSERERELYREKRSLDFYGKTLSGSGVRLAFKTDATRLELDYRMMPASSRVFGRFDVYENGVMVAHDGADSKILASGRIEAILSEGEKEVEIYLPWSKAAYIERLELDGTTLEPVKRKRKLLCFGDSITQGYDAEFPSLSYVSRLGRMLDAEEHNKGIGGDTFFPELLEAKEPYEPDIITVAYGTNDWNNQTKDSFDKSCKAFIERICELYPSAEKYVITPIWRADGFKETKFGEPHHEVHAHMEELLKELPVRFIDGYALTPHVMEFYSDKYLHPNDLGFGEYASKLKELMR